MAKTPVRAVRLDDETWARVGKVAADNGMPAATYIRRAILRALKEDES